MRKMLLGFAVVLVVCFAAYLRYRHPTTPLEVAYASNRQITLWSTTAQVREPVVMVGYGERLDVLQHFEDQVKVRTAAGFSGWMSERDLLSEDLWEKSKELEAKGATLPVEAHGHTRALSNLHLEPGRDAVRLRQLNKQVPVDLLEREVETLPSAPSAKASAASASGSTGEAEDAAAQPADAKKEDWWLVRAHSADDTTSTGWMLGRFIELEVPQPLPDLASSANMRVVAWFELDHVADASGATKAQYLVVGARGSEGQPCDFTILRVYTWGAQRDRYETAFTDSNFCGKLPVNLTQTGSAAGDVVFLFKELGSGTATDRTYHMHQTIVRRVREEGAAKPRKQAR
jgi:hypothetical protein